METVQPAGPYRLLGWSFGGLVAHRIAQMLEEKGAEVELLCMLDTHLINDHDGLPSTRPNEREHREMFRTMIGYGGPLPDGEIRWEDVADDLRRADNPLGWLPTRGFEGMLAVSANNLALAEKYRPERSSGPLLYFQAGEGASSGREWTPYVARCDLHFVNCTHDHMTKPENLAVIGPMIARYLLERA
jgi:thioesterase domain-containing protein